MHSTKEGGREQEDFWSMPVLGEEEANELESKIKALEPKTVNGKQFLVLGDMKRWTLAMIFNQGRGMRPEMSAEKFVLEMNNDPRMRQRDQRPTTANRDRVSK